jgi:hypothetical protein
MVATSAGFAAGAGVVWAAADEGVGLGAGVWAFTANPEVMEINSSASNLKLELKPALIIFIV